MLRRDFALVNPLALIIGLSAVTASSANATPNSVAPQTKETAPASETPSDPPTRELMDQILVPLSRVLPLSFDQEAFEAPYNKERITKELKTLAENVKHLEKHARSKDRAFDFIASSLRNDAQQAYRRFQRGDFEEARFSLHKHWQGVIARCEIRSGDDQARFTELGWCA